MSIYVTKPSLPSMEDFINEIKPIFDNKILTNMGPVYKKFQHMLLEYLDVSYLSLFVNGHMALENAIKTYDFPEGSEVITTPFTFVSTTHSIVRNNLKPVFCDIDEKDYTIDVNKIESLITDKTVAIVPVHVYGNICDVEAIDEIAKKHNLKVIYDAAHAFGEKYKGKGIGNFGDAVMFSFHATKVFNSVEGGAVAFKDESLRNRLHELKNFGIVDTGDVCAIGGNSKLDEIRAAMGICNLRRIGECIEKRKVVRDHYLERLSGIDGIILSEDCDDVESNYSYFPIRILPEKFGKTRDEVFKNLEENDIYARKYFYPAVNELSCYKAYGAEKSTPIAHDVSKTILTLPMYEELELDIVDKICDIIIQDK